jgi:hypothetical protein
MKRYSTLQRLIIGEWYQVDCYIFKYNGKQLRPDLVKVRSGSLNPDDDWDWFMKMSVNHSGCIKDWGEYSPIGFFWKGEIGGCKHLPNFELPKKYKEMEVPND